MPARNWGFWAFIAVLAVLHFLLHLGLGLGATAPDLLTVAVLLAARRLSGAAAAGVGLVLGLVQDSLSLVAFGADAVALAVLGFLGTRSRDFFVGDSLLFVAVYLFLGKWLHDVLYFLLYSTLPSTAGVDLRRVLLVDAPTAAVYAAIAGTLALLGYRATTKER
ncbi:MAG TPA: rod shape-determining protein MreD [Longimicrobiales bacterium]|nr:rod shape-determining protein MreD [Longimicrobiales bacterium]